MKPYYFLLAACFFLSSFLFAQPSKEKEEQERREKLELIMRFQDLRTIHDGKLISFFSDPDPIVRERAALAYGSIQDTSVMNLLVNLLSDERPNVQLAAAFAIGQTASQLSKKNKQILEHDLIWARLDKMASMSKGRESPADRLVEEIGKFGTEDALNDLLLRFGNVYPRAHAASLIMSIARFAIRNITSDGAVQYLMTFVKPADSAPWQAVYAMQRTGNHPLIRAELENLVELSKHHDPLVRMNFATLLGKIKDEKTSLDPLQKLAEFDGDWRVRVNALKALGNFKLQNHGEIVETFRRSFFNGNPYIAITALSTFGTAPVSEDSSSSKQIHEAFDALRHISVNDGNGYLWQLQSEAAVALAKLKGSDALNYIHMSDYPQRLLQARILEALGQTGDPKALESIEPYLQSDKGILHRSSLEALQSLSEKNSSDTRIKDRTFNACIAALNDDDVAVVTTAASVLGDSLFLRPSSVAPLIEKLSTLRVPDDVEAMQEVIVTLGKLRNDRAISILTDQLHQSDRSVAHAAASALKSITGKDFSSSLPKSFEPLFTDFDFNYLRSLRDPIHSTGDTVRIKLETIRGDITLDLYKNVAPFTVMSFMKLATQRGFYRGLPFHRVVPNFVIQGGDPRGDGWGGPGFSIRSEFSPLTYETGMLGVASAGKDTEGSQFFITQSPQPHLDGRYTIFGKVVTGMDVVDKIQVDDHIFDVKILQ